MAAVINELKRTNESLRVMINMQKMIIDALLEKVKPTRKELEAFKKEEEFISLEDLRRELRELKEE